MPRLSDSKTKYSTEPTPEEKKIEEKVMAQVVASEQAHTAAAEATAKPRQSTGVFTVPVDPEFPTAAEHDNELIRDASHYASADGGDGDWRMWCLGAAYFFHAVMRDAVRDTLV